jgi:hypothetical protein
LLPSDEPIRDRVVDALAAMIATTAGKTRAGAVELSAADWPAPP